MAITIVTQGQQSDDPNALAYVVDWDSVSKTLGLTVTGTGRAIATLFDNSTQVGQLELGNFVGLGRQVLETNVKQAPVMGINSPYWINVQWGA